MEEFVIHLALTLVQMFVKNPGRAQSFRRHLLELADSIYSLYPDAKK